MKAVFKSVFPFIYSKEIIGIVGQFPQGHEKGRVLVEIQPEVEINPAAAKRVPRIYNGGEIDLSQISCGYFDRQIARKAINPAGIVSETRMPNEKFNTVILVTANGNFLNFEDSEIAIIAVGQHSRMIFNKLRLNESIYRPLDYSSARRYAGNRLSDYGLQPTNHQSVADMGLIPQTPFLKSYTQQV